MLMTLNEYGKVTYFKHKQITLFEFVDYVSLNYEKIQLGVIKDGPQKFAINGYQFNKHKKTVIVTTSPFVPIDDKDENSSFSILLMHTPWPFGGEQDILPPGRTVVTMLQQLKDNDQLPTYVMPMLMRQLTSTNITANQGVPITQQLIDDEGDDIDEIQCERDTHIHIDDNAANYYQNLENVQLVNYEGITTNITERQIEYYMNFIRRSQEDCMSKLSLVNQVTPSDIVSNFQNQSISHVQNYEERLLKPSTDISKLTIGQRSAYDRAVNHISGQNESQLIMFISGEGGTGKSFIIALIMEFTRLKFGKQLGLYGATVAMAPTGCSANVISGFTWQSCYGKGKTKDKKITMTAANAKKVGERFRGTRLLVIDEISMINLESLSEISYRHQQGMLAMTDDEDERSLIKSKPFGGTHILFTGDLWQLKAIGGSPIFTIKTLKTQAQAGQKIWHAINIYSELTENYRFKNDTTTTLQDF